jgi:hypothetical protein
VRSGLHGLAYCFGRALLPGSSVIRQDQGSTGSCYCLQRSKGLPGVVCRCGSDDLRAGLPGVWVQGHQCVPAEDGPPVREVKNALPKLSAGWESTPESATAGGECSRQGRPCRKNQAETTIGNQASSDRGEARERSRRNGRSSGWRAAHRADGRGPYRRVNSRLLADKHHGTPATAAVAQKPSLAKTTRLAKQSGKGARVNPCGRLGPGRKLLGFVTRSGPAERPACRRPPFRRG